MRIGTIGAGNIGATAARLLVEAGHEVALSNSRGPDSLRGVIGRLGPRAQAMTGEDAARFGEVVLLAVPWRSPEALPSAEGLASKIIIDAMNPYRRTSALRTWATAHPARRRASACPAWPRGPALRRAARHLCRRG